MYDVGNYEEFSCADSSRQCYNENEDCEEAIVEQLQWNARRYQKLRKPMRMTRQSVSEWLTRMQGNLLLDYDFISCRKARKTVPISALETYTDFVQLQSTKRILQGTLEQFLRYCWEVYACLTRKWIKFVFRVNIFLWFAPIVSANLKSVFLLLNKREGYLLPHEHMPFLPFTCSLVHLGQSLNWGKIL
jgi:hypothetical protein